jgi:hypothetical protein
VAAAAAAAAKNNKIFAQNIDFMRIKISIFILFLIIFLCISFSEYIKYFMNTSLNSIREKYDGNQTATQSRGATDLPLELQAQQTQFYNNRQ